MTRHHEADRILADRGADRACSFWRAGPGGEIGIGGELAHRDIEQPFPHTHLKVGAVAAKSSTYLAFGHRDFMSRRAARSLPASASARPARPRGVVITSAMPNGQG